MRHKIFGFIFSVLIGSVANPGVIGFADNFEAKAPEFHAVKTVETPVVVAATKPVAATKTATMPVATKKTTVKASANKIEIAGKTLEIIDTPNVQQNGLDYVHAYRYNGKFVYGHNSGSVFGGLKNIGVGATFSVTTNGAKRNYKVAKVVIFEKNAEKNRLELNGAGNYMSLVAKARHEGVQYDLSIMTCHGSMRGNGDTTHRLVIFAKAM